MRAEYKRDMNQNYLILYEEKSIDTSSYQVRMLVGNVIPSVLKCRVQGIDGEFRVYYDITSRQPLSALFEEKKLGYEDLQLVFGGFVQVMEEMSEYLLNPGRLVIRPEYMYADVEKKELFFCYLPGFEEDVRKQFQELTEYILPRLDHEDERAVMLGYGVYRRALEDSFHLEHIKEELYRERDGGETRETVTDRQELWGTPETAKNFGAKSAEKPEAWEDAEPIEVNWSRPEDMKNPEKEQKELSEKDRIWKLLAGCGVGALLSLLILAARYLGYLPWIPVEVLLCGIVVFMGLGMLVSSLVGKKKQTEKRPDRKQENRKEKEEASTEARWQESPESEKTVPGSEKTQSIPERGFREEREEQESYGETMVLSSGAVTGPATLVSREPGELAAIYLQEDLTVIGKLEHAADAVIPLPTVSRVHAKIRRRDGEYYLTDMNSRNGTSVNGRMLRPDEDHCLQNEDEVDFAQARYIFLK